MGNPRVSRDAFSFFRKMKRYLPPGNCHSAMFQLAWDETSVGKYRRINVSDLAREMNCRRKTCKSALRRLEEVGIIRLRRRGSDQARLDVCINHHWEPDDLVESGQKLPTPSGSKLPTQVGKNYPLSGQKLPTTYGESQKEALGSSPHAASDPAPLSEETSQNQQNGTWRSAANALLASSDLTIFHPKTREPIDHSKPLPDELAAAVDLLRKEHRDE